MRTTIPVLIAVTVMWISAVRADDFWQVTRGPFGGEIQSIALGSNQEVFAAGLEGGVFRSDDGGAHWSRIWSRSRRALRVASGGGSRLYLGTLSGLFRSDDSGATWTEIGLSGSTVFDIDLDASGHIYTLTGDAGLVRSTDDGVTWVGLDFGDPFRVLAIDSQQRIFGAGSSGLYRSTDGGEHWTHLTSPWGAASVSAIGVAPNNDLYIGSLGGGIFRSSDAGTDWVPGGLVNVFVSELAIDASGRVFAGTGGSGLYRSLSGIGNDWVRADLGVDDNSVEAIALGQDGWVFAGTTRRGVVRSTDHGDHWSPAVEGLTALQIQGFLFDARGRGFATSFVGGVLSAAEGGRAWSYTGLATAHPLTLAEDLDGSTLCGTGWGVYRSQDAGISWSFVGLRWEVVYALGIDPTGGALLAGTAFSGVFISTDRGATWVQSNAGLGNLYVWDLAFQRTGAILAATDGGVFVSDDHAAHWSARGLVGVRVFKVALDSRGSIFAETAGGLFRSRDAGAHWEKLSGPGADGWRPVAIDALDQVWVGTSTGVFRSHDGGDTWTPESSGLVDPEIAVLAIDRSGYLFAQGFAGPIYRSLQPTTPVEISELVCDQEGADVVLRWRAPRSEDVTRFRVSRRREPGSSRGGLEPGVFEVVPPDVEARASAAYSFRDAGPAPGRYRYRLAALSTDGSAIASAEVEVEVSGPPSRNRITGNHPNPFNPSTSLRFGITAAGSVEVAVIDVRGRLLRTLWRATGPHAGSYNVAWDGRDAAGASVGSGVYWARLTVDGRAVDARPMTLIR